MSSSNRNFEENEDIENSEAYEDAEGYEDSAGSNDTGEEEKIKNPEKFRKHEVRKALMGNLFRDEDSGYLVVGGDFRIVLWGAADGADNAFLYGVSRRKYEYETELKNNTQAVYQVNEAMAGIGRRILF